jgi:hypothetical protein
VHRATDILKKRCTEVWTASACLHNALNEVMSNEHLDDRHDSKILAELESLCKKAQDLSKLDDKVMDVLL